MRDIVELIVNNRVFSNFVQYSIESDIYTAEDAFSFSAWQSDVDINAGSECSLNINGVRVTSGIIDSVSKSNSRQGVSVSVSGRDLMSLAVDSYCEKFIPLAGKSLKSVAETLLSQVPILSRKNIQFDDGAERLAVPATFEHIEPGSTVFQVLRDIAIARGLLFFMRPDGVIVFSKPKQTGKADFYLSDTDYLEGSYTRDISQHYRKIIVVGQSQGDDSDDPEDINISETLTDEDAPIAKTMVVTTTDGESPKSIARLVKDQNRFGSYQYQYDVAHHTKGGKVWQPERFCEIDDSVLGVRKTLLIYKCTYNMDKQSGVRTRLTLGFPGVIA